MAIPDCYDPSANCKQIKINLTSSWTIWKRDIAIADRCKSFFDLGMASITFTSFLFASLTLLVAPGFGNDGYLSVCGRKLEGRGGFSDCNETDDFRDDEEEYVAISRDPLTLPTKSLALTWIFA